MKEVKRAIEEFTEYSKNTIESGFNEYSLRIRQLFNLIDENRVLKSMIQPYLDYNLDDSKIGFITNNLKRETFVIPEDEDGEISLILKILKINSSTDRGLINITFNIYREKHYQDNLDLFNSQIVIPAFNKLLRKLNYKLEDLSELKEENVSKSHIQIINIHKIEATNSTVAIGENINQKNTLDSIFTDMINSANTTIENETDKKELIELINDMQSVQNNKNEFKEAYNAFLLKVGTYMTIFGPFLPALAEYLKGFI